MSTHTEDTKDTNSPDSISTEKDVYQHTDSVEATNDEFENFIYALYQQYFSLEEKGLVPNKTHCVTDNVNFEEIVAKHKEIIASLQAHTSQQVEEAVRKGWKGYVVVDPEAENYKYSPVFSDRKGAEIWLKGREINGLKVVEVDILLTPNHQD